MHMSGDKKQMNLIKKKKNDEFVCSKLYLGSLYTYRYLYKIPKFKHHWHGEMYENFYVTLMIKNIYISYRSNIYLQYYFIPMDI